MEIFPLNIFLFNLPFSENPFLLRLVINEPELLAFHFERKSNFLVQVFHYLNLYEARACSKNFFKSHLKFFEVFRDFVSRYLELLLYMEVN